MYNAWFVDGFECFMYMKMNILYVTVIGKLYIEALYILQYRVCLGVQICKRVEHFKGLTENNQDNLFLFFFLPSISLTSQLLRIHNLMEQDGFSTPKLCRVTCLCSVPAIEKKHRKPVAERCRTSLHMTAL